MSTSLERKHCRFCDSANLAPIIDLGDMPLVNRVKNSPEEEDLFYPLKVMFCKDCTMTQLSEVVDPEILYKTYTYRSGMSRTFADHCEKLADEISNKCKPGSVIVDIAGNDGTLLSKFDKRNFHLINVEPSNLANLKQPGITVINEFFDTPTTTFVNREFGGADVITAQNVFTHIDCVNSFMCNVDRMLKPGGVLIIEVPWLYDILAHGEFDLFYHEHLSYVSFKGMKQFCQKFKFDTVHVEHFPDLHGGSLRFYIQRKKDLPFVNTGHINPYWCVEQEESMEYYYLDPFRSKVEQIKENLRAYIGDEKIAAIGASAKGCILANYFGLKDCIDVIYDTTPDKIGKFQPGTNIPIRAFEGAYDEKRPMLILAWNWADEIIDKITDEYRLDQRFIIPLPTLEVVDT